MPPKKQKAQKMALTDFFNETSTGGSWADEMEAMPTAPAARDPGAPRRGEPGYFESLPDRGSRGPQFPGNGPPREELPLPTAPPYTAFIGNLTFETEEAELSSFFSDLKVISAKTIKDPTGKAKGFGYVEFGSLDDLKTGLSRSGAQLGGRTVRVSVAEAPANRRDASAAEESSQWRRSGPLPSRAAEPLPGRRIPSSSGFERERDPSGPERDWGAARGAKFVPGNAPPSPQGGMRSRESSGPGFIREKDLGGPTGQADEASAWRSSKPLVEARGAPGRDMPPHQRMNSGPGGGLATGEGPASPSLADTEQTWTRASKLRTPIPEAAPPSGTSSPAEVDREWRGSRATSAVPSVHSRQGSASGSPVVPSFPATRQKLQLAPRSASTTTPPTTSPATSAKASPFGAARPIDTATKEQEAAAKLASREEERKKAREAEAAKVKEEADRRLAFASAAANGNPAGSGPAATPSGPAINKRVHPSRKPSNPGSTTEATPAKSNGNVTQVNGKPSNGTNGNREDGFQPAKSGVASKEVKKEEKKKESTVRPTFSFAAAAGKLGLVDDVADDDEDAEGKTDKDVEELSEKVETAL